MMRKREVKIYCPKCEWEPVPSSRWVCVYHCVWNTFDTGGVCPDCGKAWEETQCLACQRFSPHGSWYHEFVTGTAEAKRVTKIAPAVPKPVPDRTGE